MPRQISAWCLLANALRNAKEVVAFKNEYRVKAGSQQRELRCTESMLKKNEGTSQRSACSFVLLSD
jgi:hypothetical protein